MTDEKKQTYTLRISSANSTQIIEILYEMLLDYTDDAYKAIEENNMTELDESVRKARNCVGELMESLNFTYEIAGNFLSLYVYVNRELLMARIQRNKVRLDNVKKVVIPLRDTYIELAGRDSSEPIMSNTQRVVAGYTYSKNEINEALESENNRGFYV